MTAPTAQPRLAPGHGDYLATRHFASLDGLRFICIGAVLWHHAPELPFLGSKLASRGFLGVDFFFVISGFLITTLLLRERDRTGAISLRGFYRRRILRIVPVYFFVVTMVGAYYVLVKGEADYARLWPFYYLFLSNYLTEHISFLGITWSLSVEEQYYVIWPLLMIFVPLRAMPAVIAAGIALNYAAVTGALARFGIHPFDVGPLHISMFTATFTPILLGSGAAFLLHSRTGYGWAARLLGGSVAAPLVFAAIPVLLMLLPANVVGWPNMMIHFSMTAALISIVLREDNTLRPLLTWRPVARFGQVSYGIYLYHMIALHVVVDIVGLTNVWAVLVVYAALSWAMAEVSFRTLEAYFQSLRSPSDKSVGAAPLARGAQEAQGK